MTRIRLKNNKKKKKRERNNGRRRPLNKNDKNIEYKKHITVILTRTRGCDTTTTVP